MKTAIIFLLLSLILILSFLLHTAYVKATSYECVTDLPPKPIYYEDDGTPVYIGQPDYTITTKCKGGFLAKFPFEKDE